MKRPQIKYSETKIDPKTPWDKSDKLNRKECAEALTKLLEGQQEAMTISLNGEWGSGKTFMLKRWRQDLENQGYTAIYFNAWEDDFLDDPLIAIFGQLWIALDSMKYDDELKANFTSIKTDLLPFLASRWQQGYRQISEDIIRHLSGIDVKKIKELEKTAEYSVFENYMTLAKTRNTLQKKLTELAEAVYNRKLLDEKGNIIKNNDGDAVTAEKPLVFIIDELDRCRPTFAIEVLERVKHLFHIKYMIFVFGIDRQQLGKSIRSVYGDIEVENYLHRFIDIDFQISKTDPRCFFDALWNQYDIPEYLASKTNIQPCNRRDIDEGESFKNLFADIIALHNFTLREIEHSLKLYILILRTTEPHHFTWPYLIPIFILLKMRNNDLYRKYIALDCIVTEVVDYVLPEISVENKWSCNIIEAVVYSSFMVHPPRNEQSIAIPNIIKAISEGKPIKDMPYVSKRLKEKYSNESLMSFANIVNNMQSSFSNGNNYTYATLNALARKMDLIMTGVERLR